MRANRSETGSGDVTNERVAEVVEGYAAALRERGAVAERSFDQPNERHLLWMCGQVPEFLAAGRIDKAMRWLGFLQGAMWAMGIRSVEEMKRDNMPADGAFDRDRV